MSTAQFDIKVVYDASRRRRRGAVVHSSARAAISPVRVLVIGGVLHLAVAAAMYYGTWWRADPFIYITLMTRMPIEMPKQFAANPFGMVSPPPSPVEAAPVVDEPVGEKDVQGPRFSAKSAQIIIPAVAYGWLTLASAAMFGVAMAGGAWLGAAGGRPARLVGVLGVLVLLGGTAYVAYGIWQESRMMFKPDQLRAGMGLLALLIALIGLSLSFRVRGITRLAGIIVLAGALATPVAIWLWSHSGAIDMKYSGWTVLAAAFAIHAVWGIVLVVSSSRIRA